MAAPGTLQVICGQQELRLGWTEFAGPTWD
jgi:hypothetical protein